MTKHIKGMFKYLLILLLASCSSQFQKVCYTDINADAMVDDMRIQFAGGSIYDRWAMADDGVLTFHVERPFVHGSAQVLGGRVQAGRELNTKSYSQSVELKASEITYPDDFRFLMIFELWGGTMWRSDTPYRVNLSISRQDSLVFFANGQYWDDGWHQVWSATGGKVTTDWTKLELEVTGNRFILHQDGEVIIDVTGQMRITDRFEYVHPMKLYTFPEIIEWHPITLKWRIYEQR